LKPKFKNELSWFFIDFWAVDFYEIFEIKFFVESKRVIFGFENNVESF